MPEPKLAPRNPDLEARIKKLKVQQEQKDYEKMTDNVDPWRKVELVDRIDKPISKQCKYHISGPGERICTDVRTSPDQVLGPNNVN